jgi:hypothetical protein
MKSKIKIDWKKYGFEFFSMFIAIISAFALNNWNDNRKNNNAEARIISEIANGLRKDIEDIRINKNGHEDGIKACAFWRNIILNKPASVDSVAMHYFNLTRDYISIQNVSGYETLKSKGLELLKSDSLRSAVISLYEYDYNTLRKLEEEYYEMQFQANYFKALNDLIAPNFVLDEKGNIVSINLPLKITNAEKNILLTYLWKIQLNRKFTLFYYQEIENKVNNVLKTIEKNQNVD